MLEDLASEFGLRVQVSSIAMLSLQIGAAASAILLSQPVRSRVPCFVCAMYGVTLWPDIALSCSRALHRHLAIPSIFLRLVSHVASNVHGSSRTMHLPQFCGHIQDAISRVQTLEQEGRITGVMDDRGKFIYISREEMAATAEFIMKRGRIAISELAAKSSSFIDLEPK